MIRVLLVIVLMLVGFLGIAEAEITTASWYGGSYYQGRTTAYGGMFDENKLTCASRDYSLGTVLDVENIKTGKKVRVIVTDVGPAKKYYRRGRTIDLSKTAFKRIEDLKKGLCRVRITVIK